ncbi:GntR family transcriptional regulator [Sporosarcina sp. BI001-red]|uniref:GntR family transcriptional regulator n=1 Tax=Sporosarcina sp. BI001-red TaxID=2282866 RepID=UPI000E254E71|nr:GntR family transcriptional regulator [Sporosarcina sp. BI001-red]REB06499.1 GntR family transcriptional regulator [Sporosarcina sp. BI001-red]
MPIPQNHIKPARQTAKESAFNQLQQWIIDGTLKPGEKLIDSELAQALGVSRTPIRESLQLLEVQGFVKMYPGKATQVTEIERDSINDLLPPLAAMQALASELAAPSISSETIDELSSLNKDFAVAVRSEDYFTALKIDESFHQVIVDAAANSYITSITASLQVHVRRLFFHNSIILTEQSIEEHEEIIDMLKNNRAEQAAILMRGNWLRAINEFQSLKK